MLSEELRQALINAYREIVLVAPTSNKTIENILDQIEVLLLPTNKWAETRLTNSMAVIAGYCSTGIITWDEKELALDSLLKEAGWTREELREMNNEGN